MKTTKEVLFHEVKVGQEFASVAGKRAYGGIKILPTQVIIPTGCVDAGKVMIAEAVILFNHVGYVADDAGTLISMSGDKIVTVAELEGETAQAVATAQAGATVIGHLFNVFAARSYHA